MTTTHRSSRTPLVDPGACDVLEALAQTVWGEADPAMAGLLDDWAADRDQTVEQLDREHEVISTEAPGLTEHQYRLAEAREQLE